MTLGQWLDSRTPAAPPNLRDRLHAALDTWARADAAWACEICLKAAEAILAGVVAEGQAGRHAALDLLAADALVTYAFEAASDDPALLADRSDRAMMRIARLAHAGA
jgi:hypothetical protein